jgi:hypothetical protein
MLAGLLFYFPSWSPCWARSSVAFRPTPVKAGSSSYFVFLLSVEPTVHRPVFGSWPSRRCLLRFLRSLARLTFGRVSLSRSLFSLRSSSTGAAWFWFGRPEILFFSQGSLPVTSLSRASIVFGSRSLTSRQEHLVRALGSRFSLSCSKVSLLRARACRPISSVKDSSPVPSVSCLPPAVLHAKARRRFFFCRWTRSSRLAPGFIFVSWLSFLDLPLLFFAACRSCYMVACTKISVGIVFQCMFVDSYRWKSILFLIRRI